MRGLIARAARLWALLGGALLLVIVMATAVNAGAFGLDKLARLFGGTVSGLPGYEDFVRLAIAAAVLMLLPYCQLRRGHVTVDLFLKHAPAGLHRALDCLALALVALLAFFLAYWMALGMLESRSDGVVSRVLGWPEWPFYLPGIVSLALWAAVAAGQLLARDPAAAAGLDHG